MRGLIYKDVQLFIRSIDKRLMIIAAAVIAFVLIKLGTFGGLYASVMLSYSIGLLNIMSFDSDEKAGWKNYQLALPVNPFHVVAGKYISVLYTVGFSLAGSILFNAVSSVITSSFNGIIWILSMAGAVVIPFLWAEIFLPLTYWLSFRAAQTVGIFAAIPIVYIINYFEDGAGLSALPSSINTLLIIAIAAAITLFAASFFISLLGYTRNSSKG
ncbi:MAG: ABC-2 transporter permease [Clostridia bacterium]|nr:ABC-2 transporter permease [Clostridia bacterium]NCC44082.1 ABC-2 transporter permease [Clostridia bacterium]